MKLSWRPFIPLVCALAALVAPFTGLMPDYWVTLFNYIVRPGRGDAGADEAAAASSPRIRAQTLESHVGIK